MKTMCRTLAVAAASALLAAGHAYAREPDLQDGEQAPAENLAPYATIPLAQTEPAPPEPAAPARRAIDEIVVTAQKTEQRLQDVPISVSAVSGDLMREKGMGDLIDVSTYVPNVRVETTSPTSPQVFIRGFGTNTFNPSFEPAVGLVQDEIFFGRGTYFTESMFDLERVEVLRGPQGTLFGKNTIAGVFNVSSRGAPRQEGGAGELSYTVAEWGERRLEGGAGWRFSPSFGLRLSGLLWDRDGRIDNTRAGRKEDTRDQEALRLRLQWDPLDNAGIELQAQTSDTTVNFWPRQLMNLSDDTRAYLRGFDAQVEDDPYNYQTSFDNPGELSKKSDTVLARARWAPRALEHLDLETVLVVGVSELDIAQFQDLDVSPADLLNLDEVDDYRQVSAEWRVGGATDSLFGLGERLQFLAGAYYFQSDFHIVADVSAGDDIVSYVLTDDGLQMASGRRPGLGLGAIGGFLPPLFGFVGGDDHYRFDYRQDTEAYALFGQFSWNITPHWVLTPGLRLNRETKLSTPTGTASCALKPLLQTCVTATLMGAEDYAPGTIRRTEDNVSPKVALSYFFDADVSAFASWTRGYKSGGVNSVSYTGEDLEYEPEKARAVELGLRSHWLDRTLRVNATLYRMDFDDLQVLAFNGLFFDVTNAAAAYSEGLELDLQWLTPWTALRIDGSLGLLRARYKDYASAPAPISEGIGAQQDLGGRELPFAPPVSATLTPTLEFPFDAFSLALSVDVHFQDRHYSDTDLDPNTRIPATTTYAAQLTLRGREGGWSLTLGGRNLTDEAVLNQVIDSALFPGTYVPTQQPGRSLFGMLSLRW